MNYAVQVNENFRFTDHTAKSVGASFNAQSNLSKGILFVMSFLFALELNLYLAISSLLISLIIIAIIIILRIRLVQ